MNKILKYGAASGLVTSLLPIVAYAATDMNSTSEADAQATGEFMMIFFAIYAFILIISLVSLIFWIIMLVDALNRTNWKQESDKTLWIVLLAVFNVLGAIIYYFAVKRALDSRKRAAK